MARGSVICRRAPEPLPFQLAILFTPLAPRRRAPEIHSVWNWDDCKIQIKWVFTSSAGR